MKYLLKRTTYKRQLYAGLIGSVSLFVMLFGRIVISGSSNYLFLIWNVTLAWFAWALGLAFLSAIENKRSALVSWLSFIVWLLFLPNTFYLLTDLIHPVLSYGRIDQFNGGQFANISDGSLIIFDLFTISMATWVGWFFGIISLRSIYVVLKKNMDVIWARVSISLIMAAASYAIYLGRSPRLNSWDVILRPLSFLRDAIDPILDPASHGSAYVITLVSCISIMTVFWSLELLHPTKGTAQK